MAARWSLTELLHYTGVTDADFRRRAGVSGASFDRLQADGLDDDQADRYAVRLGVSPYEVWPDWSDAVLEAEQERQRRMHRERMRRYRQRAEVRERKRQADRRYYAEAAQAIRAKRRRRYYEGRRAS